MKSMRQLREELLDVRLGASQTSIWSIATTLTKRAHAAINDAIRLYDFRLVDVYTSLSPTVRVQTVPRNIVSIVTLDLVDNSLTSIKPVVNFDFRRTPTTSQLVINESLPSSGARLEAEVETRLQEAPEDIFLVDAMSTTVGVCTVSGTQPVSYWPTTGYLEFTRTDTLCREVVHYGCATPTGFTGITRGVIGPATEWPTGARISCVIPMEQDAVACIMAGAEAAMFNYWVGHRADYDQYSALAGVSSIDIKDLLGIVSVAEERAERRYRRIHHAPKPGRVRRG
jgi:hypothetical protein